MPAIEELFDPHTARGGGFQHYAGGDAAYVTNGLKNNGVLGYVQPRAGDLVFDTTAIVLSAFCEATVQVPPFIARGNGGSGLIVLTPKRTMQAAEMAHVAAYINTAVRWRFNWYRQATVERIKRLVVPDPRRDTISFPAKLLIPPATTTNADAIPVRLNFRSFALDDLYVLTSGDFHSTSDLPAGTVPLVSCGDADNGITAFVSVPAEQTYIGRLTVSFNGMNTLTTKYHPYRFAAKDDVAVASAREPLRLSTHLFVSLMMNRERWRYSYYRKCFMEKLKRQSVSLPARGGTVDEDLIERLMETSGYWSFLKQRLA